MSGKDKNKVVLEEISASGEQFVTRDWANEFCAM